ncbi:hypothetical protein C5D50_01750 [Rathayibacter sp. RFBD1]|nr:hypothetical protein C5D50_01750 [Rathayibacter sp. RFBD1]PPI61928.1 hypothetical protein C5D38_03085 [Rathayibacter sp. TRS19]
MIATNADDALIGTAPASVDKLAADFEGRLDASTGVVARSLAIVENANAALLRDSIADGTGRTRLVGGDSVTVPSDLLDGVTLASDKGQPLMIQLPHASTAGAPAVLGDGTVIYPGQSSANSVIVSDSGVQMLTTIADAEAPADYPYEVTLSEGQTLALVDNGAALVNADGSTAVVVGDAWAIDANGAAVPTRYSVEGATLTQHVDHTATENIAYPVVADPVWLAPAVIRCLSGLALTGPQIATIASTGSPASIGGALGRAALACLTGK